MARKPKAVAGEVTTPAEAKRALEPRIYEVMDSESGKLRMVETTSQARAIRYCSKDRYSIKVASSTRKTSHGYSTFRSRR